MPILEVFQKFCGRQSVRWLDVSGRSLEEAAVRATVVEPVPICGELSMPIDFHL